MKSNLQNTQSGITLVALIITVIILLILAMVSISLVMNSGIITKSKTAVDKYSEEEIQEQIKLAYSDYQLAQWTGETQTASDYIKAKLQNVFGLEENEISVEVEDGVITVTMNGLDYNYVIASGTVTSEAAIERAKKSTAKEDSYVGYYADIDEDGIVDGVIFADLLTGSVRNTQRWTNDYGVYILPTDVTVDNVNAYYISQKNYEWAGIEHAVLSPKTTNGKQRFYVMALSDFSTPAKTDGTEEQNYPAYTRYYWYKNAAGHMSPLITSTDFGTGKENTRKMIEKWNAAGTENGYINSAQDNQDIWKHIQTKYNEGWFIPSRAELSAFANEIGGDTPISPSNYGNIKYGLNNYYWSSSQGDVNGAWYATLSNVDMYSWAVNTTRSVRLATTF